MIEHAHFWGAYWWLMPVTIMVFMMALCFFGMRRGGFWSMDNSESIRGCWFPRWDGSASAIEILNRRYARGEIQKEEYEQKRRDLERDQVP